MKNTIVTIVIILVSFALSFSQTDTTDVDTYIKNATIQLDSSNYKEAIQNLERAINKIKTLQVKSIASLLPESVGEWKLNENMQSMDDFTGDRFMISRMYTTSNPVEKNEKKDKKSEEMPPVPEMESQTFISVMISNADRMIVDEINKAHFDTLTKRNHEGILYKPLIVKDHKALLQFFEQDGVGNLSIVVGKYIIRVDGMNVENSDILMQFAESIDIDKVIKILGE